MSSTDTVDAIHGLTGLLADVREELHRLRETLEGRDESATSGGAVTAPAAGAQVAATAFLPKGRYAIEVTVGAGPGAVAADVGNMEVRLGGQVILRGLGGGLPPTTYRLERRMDGETPISVNATAAGTAGVVYTAAISATRVE